MRAKPDEVKLVLVDPKKVELSMYNGVPHLLIPVVTDPKKANIALKKIVAEMENRYDLFSESGTKNIAGYNTYVEKYNEKNPNEVQKRKLPYRARQTDHLHPIRLCKHRLTGWNHASTMHELPTRADKGSANSTESQNHQYVQAFLIINHQPAPL